MPLLIAHLFSNSSTMQTKSIFIIVFLMLLAGNGFSQVTSSSITGFIKDETNKGLPGATIRATHQPSGTAYGTVTQDDGSFNLQNMRIGGPYKVEINFIGYETKTYNDVYLTLGEPYQLIAQLNGGTATNLKEVAIVSGRNPLLNNQRTGAGTNVGADQINTLPTVSRSITDFTRLTPQGGPSFSSGLNNANTFGGRDGRYNNVQINGANFNNAFGIAGGLLPGGSAQPISLDAIEEIQVGVAPYDVRQGNFTGANINAVTRSGTNTYTGSAYMFWRNQNFNGRHIADVDLPETGSVTNNVYGARIGGPIIKNKLFFFVNGEYEQFVYPGITWVAGGNGITGQNVSRPTVDSLKQVADYLKSKGYDPGAYDNYGKKFTNTNTKFLARVDWNIRQKHKLYISYSQLNASEDQMVNGNSAAFSNVTNTRIGANSLVFENSNYSVEHTVKSISAELSSNFNSKLSNQLIGTYSYIRDQRVTPGGNFPFIDITTKASSADNFISAGTDPFSYLNDVKNTNFSINDNVTYTMGKHTFTGGIGYEYISFGNSFLPYGTGYYRYSTVSDFINDKAPTVFAYSYPYADQGGNTYVKVNYGAPSLYVQDKYNLTNRFTLTGGIRLEIPLYTYNLPGNQYIDTLNLPDKNGNITHYDVSKWPKSKLLASPRIAFNWDALGNRKLQVRGGTGIFTGRVPFVWFTNQPGNSGTLTNQVTISDAATLAQIHFNSDPNAIVNQFPSKFSQKGGASVPGQIALVSPDLKMPQIWRTNLAADVKLPWGLVGTIEGIYTKDIVNVYQRNANLPVAQKAVSNGDDTRPYWTTNRIYSNISGVYVLENTNLGQSVSGTIGVARPARKGFYGSLYYTATYAEDVSSNPGSQPNSAWNGLPNTASPNAVVLGPSEYLTPHRIVGSLSYRYEYLKHFATTLSIFYEGASAGRFSYRYAGKDINNDGVNADLIYIPNDAKDMQWADITYTEGGVSKTFTKQQQIDAFNAYMSQDKYLNANKGGYAEKYGAKYPFYHRFDAKLLQDICSNFGSKRRYTLQFSLDMMNIGNFLNPNWGVLRRLNTGSGNNANILTVQSLDANNKPTFQLATYKDATGKLVLPTTTFSNDFTTNSTWGMQMGLRLIF